MEINERIPIGELSRHIGKTVIIKGRVRTRRDQGKMIFLDIHDATGIVQSVILPNSSAIESGKVLR